VSGSNRGQINPEHQIDAKFDLAYPVVVDARRIGQLLSNLVANALTYSEGSAPVRVMARTTTEHFDLVVSNKGESIPSATMDRLFQPFSRGDVRPSQQGRSNGEVLHASPAEKLEHKLLKSLPAMPVVNVPARS
jgi:signal transduction histidine kinase